MLQITDSTDSGTEPSYEKFATFFNLSSDCSMKFPVKINSVAQGMKGLLGALSNIWKGIAFTMFTCWLGQSWLETSSMLRKD